MRILLLTPDYAQGPLASVTHHGAHALVRMAQREGHHVHVASLLPMAHDHAHTQWMGGAAVTTLALDAAQAVPAAFAHWLQSQGADAIHALAATPEALALPWPVGTGPTVVTLTGLPTPAQPGALATATVPDWLRQARHRVCTTAAAQALWQASLPTLGFRVLAPGVDLLALLRKFSAPAGAGPHARLPTVASAAPLEGADALHWVALHPVSLLGMDAPVDAVVLPAGRAGEDSLVAQECAALGLPCLEPAQLAPWLAQWQATTAPVALCAMDQPMPMRMEEEAFFYDCLYRA